MKFHPDIKVLGDIKFRGDCPKESAEQITFFNYLRKAHPKLGMIAIHPRNEGKRTFGQAARQKAEGMTTGAADVIIPCCPPIVIEIKRRDHTKSKWEDGQIDYLLACQTAGAIVAVALGWEAAAEVLNARVSSGV